MKKVFNFAAILTIAGFIIAGCNKSADEPAPAPSFSGESFAKHLMTPEGSTAFANALAEQTDVSQLKSGSEFMVPF